MTTASPLENQCLHRQPLHDTIERDVRQFLDTGRMIEILTHGACSGKQGYFNSRLMQDEDRS
jgi:hypothetical protein